MLNTTDYFYDFLRKIADLAPKNQKLYLVGGAIRDFYIHKNSYDWDFVMEGNIIPLGKKIANHYDGSFYLMDKERNIARVIGMVDGQKMVFDFATLRAPSLEEDLRHRDFTINAIAIDIERPDKWIDPLNGLQAITDKKIRLCNPDSFLEDPVRVMRAVRFAICLGFQIEAGTGELLKKAGLELGQISGERKRDELFKMFEMGFSDQSVKGLAQFGLFDILFPDLTRMRETQQTSPHIYNVWHHTLDMIKSLELLLNNIYGSSKNDEFEPPYAKLSLDLIKKYYPQLKTHLESQLSPGRSRRALIIFTGLLHDIGKINSGSIDENGRIRFFGHDKKGALDAEKIAANWVLSNEEINYVKLVVEQHMRIHSLASHNHPFDRRIMHRFFRDNNERGIDICLLSLADILATWGEKIPPEIWNHEIEICQQLFEAWFEKKDEIVAPKKLLGGDDIIKILKIHPGPLVGKMVRELQEAQATGEVLTVSDAVNYIKRAHQNHSRGE